MSGLRAKAAGVLLALLVASMEFTPNLLVSRVLAQQDSYEDFLSRLEGYLRDALPPESDPVRECEYVAPEGFNASMAERLWRIVGSSVSMGASEEEIRGVLQNATSSGSSGMLNVTGTMVEKPGDGSVKVKIPVSSDKLLNYTYFNSTDVRMLYEVWNETLVRYYGVERYTGLYRYVVKDIETGVVFDFVSRLGVSPFPGFALEDIMLVHPEENWPWFLGNPIIAIPGHYEEVKTLVPEHEESYRVLFPAYDPIIIEGWVVSTSVSSTSLSVGETLQISYLAEYCSFPGEEPEPLNATLTLNAPKSFQPLNSVERRLSDAHKSGSFNLKAVKPGTYNITLRLSGNAQFPHVPGDEETYTIQVVSPPAPSLSVEIVERDTSIPKHARLVLRLRNSGGSPARNVVVEIAGACLHGLNRSVGSIEAGETRDVELSLRLLNPSCDARISVAYRDDDGNPYLVGFWTRVSTERFWVPEHFEEYVVTVPEHEEVTRVFVPGSEQATHVRFYWLTFRHLAPAYPGELVVPMPTFQGHYGGFELVSHLTPTGMPELNASGWNPEKFGNPDMVMLSLEPYLEQVGVLEEKDAAGMLGVKPGVLRVNSSIREYRTRLVSQTWRTSGSIMMNATQFATYNHSMSSYIAENSLQDEFKIGWRKLTNATRLSKPSNETGFLTLIYRPLSVKGSGPLKTIQVRNYAGLNASYVMRIQQFGRQAYMNQPPTMDVYSSPLTVNSGEYNVSLVGLNAAEGYTCLVKLLFGSSVVAEAVFDLNPEPSPFWGCFWEEVRGRIPWILATSTIIILVGFLTGHGTTAAYAGLAVSVVSTITYLVSGTVLNWVEIEQCRNAYSFYNSLADAFRDWSYELSNYTPPEAGLPPGPPTEAPKPFEPKGPLAALYWNYSQYFRGVANRILEDTVLDLVVGCGVTDFETAMNRNASECARGRATGRIVSAALSFAAFLIATKIASIEAKAANAKAPWRFVSTVKAWVTPAIYDLLETLVKGRRTIGFIVRNPGQALQIGKFLLFRGLKTVKSVASEAWESAKHDVKELVEKIETGVGRIEDSWDKAVERLKDFLGFHDEFHSYAKKAGQEKAISVSHKFDGAGFEVPEQAEAFRILDEIAVKSRLAEEALSELLKQLEPERLKKAVKLMGGMDELEKSVLDDFGKAWLLNKDADDLYGLLKGLSMAPDYPAQGSKFYELLHKCVEDNDPNEVGFLGRSYNWITEIRKMELEPGERFAKYLEETFPFVEGCVDSLGGEELEKVAGILDNLLATRGRRGAYEEMLRLKEHLFEDILLGTDAPKNWLVEECLEKWDEASMLSDAIVSHQMLDKNGHYRARSPVEVNYLDAGDDKVIPVLADEDKKGGFGITIPQDAAEYLRLKDEGFLIFFKNLPQSAKEIVPVKVDGEGKVALTEWFEKVFKKKPGCAEYFDENGRIKWDELGERHMLLEIEASKGQDRITRLFAFTEREQEIIRVRVGELAKKDDIVECVLRLMDAEDFLQGKYEISGEVAQKVVRRMYNVMQYETREELDAALATVSDPSKYDLIGAWGEWKVFQIICEHKSIFGEIIGCQVSEGGVVIDFITTKYLVEVKNWDWEDERLSEINRNSLVNQMKGYKMAQDSKYIDKKVVVFFYREMLRDIIGDLISDFLKIFQDRSMFEIVNGVNELSKLG